MFYTIHDFKVLDSSSMDVALVSPTSGLTYSTIHGIYLDTQTPTVLLQFDFIVKLER